MDEDEPSSVRIHQRADVLVEVLQTALVKGAILPHQVVLLKQEEGAVLVSVLIPQAHSALWEQAITNRIIIPTGLMCIPPVSYTHLTLPTKLSV